MCKVNSFEINNQICYKIQIYDKNFKILKLLKVSHCSETIPIIRKKCLHYIKLNLIRKADRTVGVYCNIFSNILSGTA